jgi:hypothetical protein
VCKRTSATKFCLLCRSDMLVRRWCGMRVALHGRRCTTHHHTSTRSALAAHAAATVVCKSILGLRGAEEALQRLEAASCEGKRSVVVVHDVAPCAVARVLAQGYKEAFSGIVATAIPFRAATFFDDLAAVGAPGAVVVLIQNGAFQNELKTYRVRMALWDRGFKVAEHGHLDSITPASMAEDETEGCIQAYLNACTLCPFECDAEGRRLAAALNAASAGVVVETRGGHKLTYGGPLETCLLNTGTYHAGGPDGDGQVATGSGATASSRPVGGSYPFGEIISESRRLSDVNGTASVFAYPSLKKTLAAVDEGHSFVVRVENGVIVDCAASAPSEFHELLALVRTVEKEAVIRELGIGLNRAFSKHRRVGDITAFERQFGLHFSVGKRHPLFVKPKRPALGSPMPLGMHDHDFLTRKEGKFHLDVFLDATNVTDRASGASIVDFT